MKLLSKFHKDERGILIEWIVGIFGVFLLITTYAIYMPIGNVLIKTFVENGAPIADMMWIRTCAIWTFGILGVMCILYPFVSSYRRVYDPSLQQGGGWG